MVRQKWGAADGAVTPICHGPVHETLPDLGLKFIKQGVVSTRMDHIRTINQQDTRTAGVPFRKILARGDDQRTGRERPLGLHCAGHSTSGYANTVFPQDALHLLVDVHHTLIRAIYAHDAVLASVGERFQESCLMDAPADLLRLHGVLPRAAGCAEGGKVPGDSGGTAFG